MGKNTWKTTRRLTASRSCRSADEARRFVELPTSILGEKLEPDRLADLAIESVAPAGDRNGIKYLADNIAKGIRTPLTLSYRDAILRKTGASDLIEAENKARSGDGIGSR